MPVLSHNHHARHLSTDEEQATFERTAPIMTASYWDLADELRRPDRDVHAIADAERKMIADLAVKSHVHSDTAQLAQTRQIVRAEIDQVINH